MGTPKHLGVMVIGTNQTAVDATVCRLMKIDPRRIEYLRLSADRLGPIDDRLIDQRAERWQPLATPFEVLDVPHLRGIRQG
jgi:uncharacterized protein (DUF362 family)